MPRLEHSYRELSGGRWMRGNLHTHTTQSDGRREPQAVIDDYASRGHDFLMISDHDVFTGQEAHGRWDAREMVLVPGNEITAFGPHLLHVGAERRVEPTRLRQQVILDAVAAGGFVVVNHPNWQEKFDHCPLASMREWIGYIGMEIYNGVIGRLDGSEYAANKWDMLLSEGRRVWGFANDDSHLDSTEVGLGWNVAYVKGSGWPGVVEALRVGRFYASTGVTIDRIEVEGMTVRVEAPNAKRIAAMVNVGKRIKVVEGSSLEVTVPDTAKYVRVECWGAGEQMAWTQPMFVEA